MLPPITAKLSMSDLLGLHAHQLTKREEDLIKVHENVVKACFTSTAKFVKQFEDTIHDYDFQPGDLVLVLNKALAPESNNKCRPQYFGPMIVVRHVASGSYRLYPFSSSGYCFALLLFLDMPQSGPQKYIKTTYN